MKKKLITLFTILLFSLQALVAQEQELPKWKFSISGGAGFQLGDTKESVDQLVNQGFNKNDAEEYVNSLKWSGIFRTEAYYLFKPFIGMGMKYIFSGVSAKKDDLLISPYHENMSYITDIEERDYFHLLAPTLYLQEMLNARKSLLFNQSLSLGYMRYRGESELNYSRLLTTGNSAGLALDLGLEYFFRKNWSISANFAFIHSTFGKITLNDGYDTATYSLNEKLKLNRIDLSMGVHFYVFK